MSPVPDLLAASPSARMRRLVYDMRTEGGGPGRDAAAVGVGIFLGCTPFYGFHLLLCLAAGSLLRLNRLKVYVAANISNPLVAPFLIFSELQVGALVRRGELHALTLQAVRSTDPWRYGADLLAGSLVVGSLLGLAAAVVTWLLTRGAGRDPLFADLVRRASDRFVLTSVIAWEFAKGKLWGDPIYRSLLFDGQLPSGGTLVDVGCGTGLTLALLDEAAAGWRNRRWPPAAAPPPVFDRLVGIELRPRAARLARQALGASATIVEGDARRALPAAADAMLFFDVLQMLPGTEQVALLAAAREAVTDGGVMLIREADAAAGRRFTAIKVGNRFKALAFGYWSQAFHFRTAAEWTRLFESLGFVVERREMGGGTPFGNVLFRLSVVPDAGSTTRP